MKIKRKLLYSVVVLGIAIIIAAAFASCKKADTTSARGVENNSAAEISKGHTLCGVFRGEQPIVHTHLVVHFK